jgi:segregation and condensation protein A
MDLLLYLIRKEEVDIYDIPIARITRQYLQYIQMMKTLNLEIAGEFILMAATLIRIKTRLLLPRNEDDPDEIDPREELILALVEYRKFKEAGEILRERAILEEKFYVPPSPVGKMDPQVELQQTTSLFDLLMAFREVLSARRDEMMHEVDPEEISIEDRIVIITKWLLEHEMATFADLFTDIPRKMVAIVTFLAILELARTRKIKIMQVKPYGEIRVYRGKNFADALSSIEQIDFETLKEGID